MKTKSLKKFVSKLRICGSGKLWACISKEGCSIPKDIPKVIDVALLEHPLFRLLLDQAAEAFDFTTPASKLCIPCNENLFLTILCSATCSPKAPHP
ncbi:hypothetical protein EUGRSUZ_L02881 [Eucalyptus grandis]|uniref:Uncharacterized protein n=1 Tax=Eucalyptus grandis TaxID=71139 RepID=A0AAD9WH82_EUCGR|nr:hypothetical protein EUGRSUZ_L02881 [Eucalyptus grandis]